jgi:hypothetical protein
MAETNPFESPTATANADKEGRKTASVGMYAAIGGGIGLTIGLMGIIALFFMFPGAPGIAELLILLVGTVIVFVVPGITIGVLIGFVINSASSKKA